MGYNTRSKKNEQGQGDMKEKQTKENSIADNPCVLQPDKSNTLKEDKTKQTSQNESTTMITKRSITNELGKINHNLDVFKQNIREDTDRFNKDTILMVDIGGTMRSYTTGNKYGFVCKIGFGGFSIVWLVVDMNNKEFRVAKVFSNNSRVTELELDFLERYIGYPNIIRIYDDFVFKSDTNYTSVVIYEPMGKDLYKLMKEASKHGGFSISVVKKVAKHILMALKTIHGHYVVHSDIKLQNIAASGSQLSLRNQLEKIVESMKSGKNLSSLRMVCDKSKFDVNINGKVLEKILEEVSNVELKDETELIFKLIDFGNLLEEGTESPTGTYGFRPPEYFFGAPLLPSHDIWSLGVTIVVILTNKNFLKSANNEIKSLRNMFGKFSRRHFKEFKDPRGYKKKFSTPSYSGNKAKKQLKKLLQKKFKKLQMHEDDRQYLIDFLIQIFNTDPNKRKSAAELLTHTWLKVEADEQLHENKPICNSEPDLNQKISDASKTQQQKEKIINEIGTRVASFAVPSNNNGTYETPLDEGSNDKQMRIQNPSKPLGSTDPKHSKNCGGATEKKKERTKNNRSHDPFIYLENDGKYYLYYRYWRIPQRNDKKNLFRCPNPKCRRNISFEPKIGFVMVKKWHKYGCIFGSKSAPPEGHRFKVKYYPENQIGFIWNNVVITNEEVDSKRNSLENQGYKFKVDQILPDTVGQKEAKINELDDLYYDKSSDETDDTEDSDTDESEDDSNKTISEFSSDESYVEGDATNWSTF